ncbi:MAG: bifunctional hydroxymethylpyrimidine kinase/phosphomethylpyrimidine kinase [Candidatus Poribacteria bacterium]|nr:bifunctional hydroxymethylpyrimidine kinase/phosphomethylpyrimidine kinase [Candidatus Poribacteria bacterium]
MIQVLTIAGSDSGGGAGVQADIKSIHANGGFAMSVLTSVTAQNSLEITRAYELPIDLIEAQFDAVFTDFEVSAVKTGMLSSSTVVQTVARKLGEIEAKNIVVDPVIFSKSKYSLLETEAIDILKATLIPLATLITPNLHEAESLAECKIETLDDAKRAAKVIHNYGCKAVLVKGGHLPGNRSIDVLYNEGEFTLFDEARIETKNTHGTGCTYSAAIATRLAQGLNMVEAVETAKEYITNAIRDALDIGHGHGPTNHFYFLDRDWRSAKS